MSGSSWTRTPANPAARSGAVHDGSSAPPSASSAAPATTRAATTRAATARRSAEGGGLRLAAVLGVGAVRAAQRSAGGQHAGVIAGYLVAGGAIVAQGAIHGGRAEYLAGRAEHRDGAEGVVIGHGVWPCAAINSPGIIHTILDEGCNMIYIMWIKIWGR